MAEGELRGASRCAPSVASETGREDGEPGAPAPAARAPVQRVQLAVQVVNRQSVLRQQLGNRVQENGAGDAALVARARYQAKDGRRLG